MLKATSKKVMSVITISSMVLAVGAVAYAETTLKKITAYQNAAISIEVDNQKVSLSSSEGTMYPIVYEGHSYVSAKAVAEALGATVEWDNSRKVVAITSANNTDSAAAVPDKDNTVVQATAKPAATPAPQATQSPAASSSVASGSEGTSIANAVKLGSSYTFSDKKSDDKGEGNTVTAQYTFKVNKVSSFSLQQMTALGYDIPDSYAAKMEFLMLDVSLKAKDVTLVSIGTDKYSTFLSTVYPYIWGVKTAGGNDHVGAEYIGFEGALDDKLDEVGLFELEVGKPKSYEVSGKVILPVIKGEENYLVLQRENYTKYDDSFIYFKLK